MMQPISLHPDNPRYFLFRGEPIVLIASGEHYGAVLNADFQAVPYLDEVKHCGLNLTRTFTGVYCEHAAAFNIARNTLAPLPGKLLCPWARSAEPGYAGGGNKFDLSRWDEAYFARLREFCALAAERGIVIELSLFCPYYGDEQWNLAPIKAGNNVNGIGDVGREEALTLKHPELVAVQDAMTRKVVAEVAEFDNLYFEICNEPYFGGVTLDWQAHIAATIVAAEKGLGTRHLIAQNIANGSAKVAHPDPSVSIFNFHYAYPPDAVRENWGLKRPIGFDETGFQGTDDRPYRTDAWHFLLAGGAVYSHLDYSFVAGEEGGTFAFPPTQPGGGGKNLRAQFRILKQFIEGFEFVKMAPDHDVIVGCTPEGTVARALSQPGKAYAIYVSGGAQADLLLGLPEGQYKAEWLNPRTGAIEASKALQHTGGTLQLRSPAYAEDIALRVVREAGA